MLFQELSFWTSFRWAMCQILFDINSPPLNIGFQVV
jgi:hypothetical protein